MLAKARSIDGFENMSQQQLENTFTAPFTSKPLLKPVPKPKKHTPTTGTRHKNLHLHLLQNLKKHAPTTYSIDDKFEKSEIAKNRSLA